MKRVYSSFDRIAVHHAKNLLEASGIHALVKNEVLGSAMGELPPAECQVELWVLADGDAERAAGILKGNPERNGGPPWKCASCGEISEPQFTQCWKCGAGRA